MRTIPSLVVGFIMAIMTSITPWTHAQDMRFGLVSYWPLDDVNANDLTTPDPVTGNHMVLNFMDASSLVEGRHGMAMTFDGFSQYLSFITPPDTDTGLPISAGPSFSVLLWVKGVGTGQNDRRVFSEGSSLSNDPLFNIGTHNTGANDTVDIFIRNQSTRVNHYHSRLIGYDDQWRHIAWSETNGTAMLYVDGILDTIRLSCGGT